jgi:hypothetical protein
MENEVDGAGTAHRSRVDHWEAGVNVLSVVLGEQKNMQVDGRLHIGQR